MAGHLSAWSHGKPTLNFPSIGSFVFGMHDKSFRGEIGSRKPQGDVSYVAMLIANSQVHPIAGAPGKTRGRQAVQVRSVPEAIQSQDGPPTAHVPPHRREAVLL